MSVLNTVRRVVQRTGIDLRRFPYDEPGYNLVQILLIEGFDHVLDVGANDGGYAKMLREFGYKARVTSFEPLTEPFARLHESASTDEHWDTWQCAIGAEDGKVLMNVAGNGGASSSILTMTEPHLRAAPESQYVGTERIVQRKLDSVWDQLKAGDGRALLKIDVQGYEEQVLRGAEACLTDGRIDGVQIEVSFTELYAGGWTWQEAFSWLDSRNFRIVQVIPGFFDRATRRMLQADVIAML